MVIRYKKRTFAVLMSFLIAFLLAGCGTSENPVSSAATEGNGVRVMLRNPVYKSVPEIMKWASGVVIASFKDDPRTVPIIFPHEAQAYDETGKLQSNFNVSKYTLSVEKVIAGDFEEEIILSLFGSPGDADYEADLKANTRYVFFLHERDYEEEQLETKTQAEKLELDAFFEDDKLLYQLLSGGCSVFEILEDDSLLPYSTIGFSPSFDGKPLEGLIQEIQTAAAGLDGSK